MNVWSAVCTSAHRFCRWATLALSAAKKKSIIQKLSFLDEYFSIKGHICVGNIIHSRMFQGDFFFGYQQPRNTPIAQASQLMSQIRVTFVNLVIQLYTLHIPA